ncbi:MAG TPA: hypothetical protein VM686_37130, partial [Polyangiaceae bacterium]|nr:hypothetical protein [Polyangiaceae bacterium]
PHGVTSSQSGTGSLFVVFKGTCVDNGAPNKHQLHNLRTIKGLPGAVTTTRARPTPTAAARS